MTIKKINRIIALTSLLVSTSLYATPRHDYYRIYPTMFDVYAEHIWHNSFVIVNGGMESVRLKVTPVPMDIDHRGPFKGDKSLIPTEARSHFDLRSYLHFSPKYIALRPFEEKRVNVRVLFPKNIKPGTYWAALHFSMLSPGKNPLMVKRRNKDDFGTDVTALLDEIVPIYIDADEQKRDLRKVSMTCTIRHSNQITFHVSNPTNWAFEPVFYANVSGRIKPYRFRPFPAMPQTKVTRFFAVHGRTITDNTLTYKLPFSEKNYKITCKDD